MVTGVCFGVLLASILMPVIFSERPGIRTAITAKGLNFVCHTAIKLLEKELPSLRIPDLNGKTSVHVIVKVTIDYSVSNIQLSELDIPQCSLTSSSDGLTLQASDMSGKLTAHVKAEHKGFPHVSASSNMEITLKEASFKSLFRVNRDSSGRANFTTSDCSADLGSVHVSFHGGADWLYNLFDGAFEDALKKAFHKSFCSSVTNQLTKQGSHALESLPLTTKFDDLAIINYTLTQQPEYTDSYMAVSLKGEFQPIGQGVYVPFSPPPLPPVKVDDGMLYVWLSDYIPNSATYVLQKDGVLTFTVTPEMIPKGVPFHLNTSSFRPLVPQLYDKFPNMAMQIVLRAGKPPVTKIHPEGAKVVAVGDIDMDVIFPNKTVFTAFTISLNTVLNVVGNIHADGLAVISANISLLNSSLALSSSNIGKFNPRNLESIINLALRMFAIPAANKHLSKGIEIPAIDGLHFTNPKISFGNDYALLVTDVQYEIF